MITNLGVASLQDRGSSTLDQYERGFNLRKAAVIVSLPTLPSTIPLGVFLLLLLVLAPAIVAPRP